MCRLIEEIATEKGIDVNDANYIFTFISGYLIEKIPALSQVIEDVFENAEAGKLQNNISRATELMQEEQWKEKFKNYLMPHETVVTYKKGGGLLF